MLGLIILTSEEVEFRLMTILEIVFIEKIY